MTAVVTDADDGMLLMVAHMNAEALSLTIETGIAHLLVTIARIAVEKGRDVGQRPKSHRDAGRLRPGRDLAARESVGRRRNLSHRQAFLLLQGVDVRMVIARLRDDGGSTG